MSFTLAHRLDDIEPFHVMEVIKRAADLEQAGRSIIHLSIGEPDFPTAQPVLEAAARALQAGALRYTHATGLPALREAISAHYRAYFGLDVSPERIVITAGASGALLLACAALVRRDCEVLMPDPSYPCNRHFVAAFEGRATMIPCGPQERFQLTSAMVRAHWSERTAGVLLASPSNPTGTSIPTVELRAIAEVARERGGFTLVDEIYQGLRYDAKPESALALGEDLIVINSFSKYYNMTGWRLGWLVVPPTMLSAIEKLAQNMFICASSIAQQAALACFTPEAEAIFESRKEEFRRRRDYLVPALKQLGFDIPVVPDGAFYIYADCTAFTQDTDAFARELLDQTGVVLVPGLDFGEYAARRYLRVSYATSMENLAEAIDRLGKYLAGRRSGA
ncbi:MAG: pyridoxal phosphate-dependent aminotransferase [Oxalobacteraceae bacterium]